MPSPAASNPNPQLVQPPKRHLYARACVCMMHDGINGCPEQHVTPEGSRHTHTRCCPTAHMETIERRPNGGRPDAARRCACTTHHVWPQCMRQPHPHTGDCARRAHTHPPTHTLTHTHAHTHTTRQQHPQPSAATFKRGAGAWRGTRLRPVHGSHCVDKQCKKPCAAAEQAAACAAPVLTACARMRST
jgi:hypothetical protein